MSLAEIAAGLFLIICGLSDIKNKEISLVIVGVFGVLGLVIQLVWAPLSPIEWSGGAIVGLLAFAIGFVTRESIGYGDAFVIGVIGIFLGLFATIEILLMALVLSAVISGFLLLHKKVGRKYRIPFVPFLFAAYIVWITMEMKEVM